MNTKQKIIEKLEGKRTKAVWELIVKAIKENYSKQTKIDYLDYEEEINDKENRYIIVEHYNFGEGFYCRFYSKNATFKEMFEDYFFDTKDSTGEEILCVDMEEMKCYLISKEVEYPLQKIKIK